MRTKLPPTVVTYMTGHPPDEQSAVTTIDYNLASTGDPEDSLVVRVRADERFVHIHINEVMQIGSGGDMNHVAEATMILTPDEAKLLLDVLQTYTAKACLLQEGAE